MVTEPCPLSLTLCLSHCLLCNLFFEFIYSYLCLIISSFLYLSVSLSLPLPLFPWILSHYLFKDKYVLSWQLALNYSINRIMVTEPCPVVSLWLSVFLTVLFVTYFACLYITISVSFFLHLSIYLSLWVSLSIYLSIFLLESLSLSIFLLESLSLSLSEFVSLSL